MAKKSSKKSKSTSKITKTPRQSAFSRNINAIKSNFANNNASKWLSSSNWKKPRIQKETAAESYAQIPIEDISKLKSKNPSDMKKMAKILSGLQQSFVRRANQFIKSGIFSHAVQSVLDQSPLTQTPAEILKNSENSWSARNKMLREIVIYQKFFTDQTSTLRGAYNVAESNAIRIFGSTPKGAPTYMPTQQEWAQYWSVYSEYMNMYKTDNSYLASDKVQQILGYYMQRGELNNGADLISVLDKIHRELHRRVDEELYTEFMEESEWSDMYNYGDFDSDIFD